MSLVRMSVTPGNRSPTGIEITKQMYFPSSPLSIMHNKGMIFPSLLKYLGDVCQHLDSLQVDS